MTVLLRAKFKTFQKISLERNTRHANRMSMLKRQSKIQKTRKKKKTGSQQQTNKRYTGHIISIINTRIKFRCSSECACNTKPQPQRKVRKKNERK